MAIWLHLLVDIWECTALQHPGELLCVKTLIYFTATPKWRFRVELPSLFCERSEKPKTISGVSKMLTISRKLKMDQRADDIKLIAVWTRHCDKSRDLQLRITCGGVKQQLSQLNRKYWMKTPNSKKRYEELVCFGRSDSSFGCSFRII